MVGPAEPLPLNRSLPWRQAWFAILVVNSVIFLWMVHEAGTVSMPPQQVLLDFGAKDPVLIARGEWWRLITPMLIHIGILHFAMNSYAIYVIAPQVEAMIGSAAFVVIYILAGIFGGICSQIFSVVLSAGASGAIMGLLGVGLYIELRLRKRHQLLTGQKPRAGAYMINTIGILVLGLVIPNIDNAAHIGGLVAGFILASALLSLRLNRLQAYRPRRGWWIAGAFTLMMTLSFALAAQKDFALGRMQWAAQRADAPQEKYYLLSRLIEIDMDRKESYLLRLSLCLEAGDYRAAYVDVETIFRNWGRAPLVGLKENLESQGQQDQADILQKFIEALEPDSNF